MTELSAPPADQSRVGVPWPGADNVSDDELLDYKLRLGYKVCKVCKPSFRRVEGDESQ